MIAENKNDSSCTLPVCPKCGSRHIDQFRMLTGSIWCMDCGYTVENKEIDHSFYPNNKS